MSDDIKVAPTEPEIADVLLALRMFPTLALTVRRLAFERDSLRAENEKLCEQLTTTKKEIETLVEEIDAVIDVALCKDGWQLVPKNPTADMRIAFQQHCGPADTFYAAYTAMLDAARKEEPTCQPTLTECPRCHNDTTKCDGVFKGFAAAVRKEEQ